MTTPTELRPFGRVFNAKLDAASEAMTNADRELLQIIAKLGELRAVASGLPEGTDQGGELLFDLDHLRERYQTLYRQFERINDQVVDMLARATGLTR